MKAITLNNIINLFLFLFIFTSYLFSYRDLTNVSNGIAILLMLFIWMYFLLVKKKLVINYFLILYLVFLFMCLFSVFYSIDKEIALIKVRSLTFIFFLLITLFNYIDSFNKVRKLMLYFVISGFVTSISVLLTSDFEQMRRFGHELGNVNTIGVIIGISVILCMYFLIEEKKYWLAPAVILMVFVVFLTGSRTALIFTTLSIILYLYLKNKNNITSKIKFYINTILFGLLSIYLIFNIPILYQVLGRRIENVFSFMQDGGTWERSINLRADMVQIGIELIKDRPFFGYGIDNYRFMFNHYTGIQTYSHNNLIELAVGIGILGAIIFYLILLITLRKLNIANINGPIKYIFISIILSYIVVTISTIYYYNKLFYIVLLMGCAIGNLYKNKIRITNKMNV